MRLIRVEIRRLLCRRLFRIMLVLVLAGLALLLGTTAYESREASAADRAQAEAQLADARRQMPPIAEQIEDCERQEKAEGRPPGDFQCEQIQEPAAADFMQDRVFRVRDEIDGRVVGFAAALALFAFVIGASFIGAEWSAGTLASLLTWEPRRLRVLLAKVLGLSTVVAIVGLIVMAAAIGGHVGVAAWRGDTTGMTDGLLMSAGLTALRGVALAIAAGLIGFAIAATARYTAAALGTGFAYFLGAEVVVRNFWEGSTRWLFTSNVQAWLSDGVALPESTQCPPGADACTYQEVVLSLGDSALYFGVLVCALLVICAVIFRRRDVT